MNCLHEIWVQLRPLIGKYVCGRWLGTVHPQLTTRGDRSKTLPRENNKAPCLFSSDKCFFCFLKKCFVVPFFFRQHNRPLSCRIVTDVSSPFSAVTSLFRQGGDRFASPESENGSNEVGGLRENMKDVAIVRASVSFPCGDLRAPPYLVIARSAAQSRVVVG